MKLNDSPDVILGLGKRQGQRKSFAAGLFLHLLRSLIKSLSLEENAKWNLGRRIHS